MRGFARQGKDEVAAIAGDLGLTWRQAEVVQCMVLRDFTANETATALGIHVRTVKGHLSRLREGHDLSSVGLVKRVCAVLRGPLDREVVDGDGRLCVAAMVRRLGVSPRFAEVMRLLWEGKSSKEIAGVLSLSPHTVDNYRRRLRRRLGVSSTGALVHKIHEQLTRRRS